MTAPVPCCTEPGCRRRQPPGLYLADFSNQVFLVTRYRVRGTTPGGRESRVAAERHDITRQMEQFVRDNPGWVRELLDKETAS